MCKRAHTATRLAGRTARHPIRREMREMKGNSHRRLRIWLVLAVVVASLGIVSSASARYLSEDTGMPATVAATTPAVDAAPSDGFSWGDALIGAGVTAGGLLGVSCAAYAARTRSRLAL
jgi:hypothetical protein